MIGPNGITLSVFERQAFAAAVAESSGGTAADAPPQVDYLSRYAERLQAGTVVQEHVYVDRHYMDEFASYYSRMLNPPPHTVQRFHLFKRAIADADLTQMMDEALGSHPARDRIERSLSEDYLGFISVRPIPSAPIGRTVLRRVADDVSGHRDIWATTRHDVHLGNLRLQVEGLAFQQQDVAVGACATASVWSALTRVAKHEGMRAPTPSEVSEAAGRHALPYGRTMPALSGMSMAQVCEAIRTVGFAPEAMRPGKMPEIFLLGIHTYLLSGIPVVLGLWNEELGAHAVCAVGFQIGVPNPQLQTSVQVRSAAITKLYVHDDGVGPYARTRVFYRPRLSDDSNDIEEALLLGIDNEVWSIDSAVAPVYPKLRLPVRSLVALAELMVGGMENVVGPERAASVNVEFQYARAGDYLRDLSSHVPFKGGAFLRDIVLSRWCAVLRWFVDGAATAEFLYDTTDILRNGNRLGRDLLRAIVCLSPEYVADLQQLASVLRVPIIPSDSA